MYEALAACAILSRSDSSGSAAAWVQDGFDESGRFLHEPPRPVDEIAFFVDLKKFSIDF